MDLSYIATKPKNVQRPRTLVCYICGREYGTRSLEIHLKTCEKKWDIEQSKLPAKKRKPCPEAPRGFMNMIRMAQGKKPIGDEHLDIEGYNQMNTNIMMPGGNRKIDPAAAIQKYNEDAYKNWDQNILEPCPHCNRTFLPERIHYHLKACTADKPLKPPLRRGQGPEEEKVANLGLAARYRKSSAAQPRQFKTGSGLSKLEKDQDLDDIYQRMVGGQPNNNKAEEKKSKWREEREKFIAAVRLGKQINQLEKDPNSKNDVVIQSKIRELAEKIPSQQDNLVQCPHCQRKFNKNAADRHIPKCQDIMHKPKPPPSKEDLMKKQQERRSQYGSPSKRTSRYLNPQNPQQDLGNRTFDFGSSQPQEENVSTGKFGEKKHSFMQQDSKKSEYWKGVLNNGPMATLRPPTGFKDLEPPQAEFKIPTFGAPKSPNINAARKSIPSLLDRSALYSNSQCPHCLRKFSDKAAQRHIPVCPQKGKEHLLPRYKTQRPVPQQEDRNKSPFKGVAKMQEMGGNQYITADKLEQFQQFQRQMTDLQPSPKQSPQIAKQSTFGRGSPQRASPKRPHSPLKTVQTIEYDAPLPKFCTQCGCRFITDKHKFCGECGSKRDIV